MLVHDLFYSGPKLCLWKEIDRVFYVLVLEPIENALL